VSRPLRAALELADQHVQDAVLARVAPHVPLVHALGVHFVKGALRTLVVPRLEALVPLRASACSPQWRLLVPQRSALAQHPYRARPWNLAQ
jgi:hypothetical protein